MEDFESDPFNTQHEIKFEEKVRELILHEYTDIPEYGQMELETQEITLQIVLLDNEIKELYKTLKTPHDDHEGIQEKILKLQNDCIDLQSKRWNLHEKQVFFLDNALEVEKRRFYQLSMDIIKLRKKIFPLDDPSLN